MNKTSKHVCDMLEKVAEDIDYIRDGMEMTFQRELADFLANMSHSVKQSIQLLQAEEKPKPRRRSLKLAVNNTQSH
jgi:gas vesicle protein